MAGIYRIIALVLLVTAISACSSSSAQSNSGNNSLIQGRYLYKSTGYSAMGLRLEEVGEIFADGQGRWHLNGWMNTDGAIVRANSDWEYTLNGLEGEAHSNVGDISYIFVSSDGRAIYMVSSNPSSPWLAIFTKDGT